MTDVAPAGSGATRVFISYSHDPPAHSDCVLTLAQRLRREGLDSIIDQFVPFPREGWIRWMERQLEDASFVLCVCTRQYRASFDGHEPGYAGRGVSWEGARSRSGSTTTGGTAPASYQLCSGTRTRLR
jgi:SEFIR domain